MGSAVKVNENLVSQLSLLAAGSSCVALGGLAGGAAIAFGIFAAPVVGVGAWGFSKWMKRFQTKDPKAHKTIEKIQARINETLMGDARFAAIDNETRGIADEYLPKLLSNYWPAPKIIAELASDMGGFPTAIAEHILDEINGADFDDVPDHFFEEGQARDYAELVITIALNASLEDEDYFKMLQPKILMQNLKLTGQIKRDVEGFIEKLDALQNFLGEKLDRIEDKVDQVLTILRDGKTATPEEQDSAEKTIREMLSSNRQATQDAVKEIMATPSNPVAATNRLKQAIAEQSDARIEAAQNEIQMLQEIATINYFINGDEAVKAYQRIVELDALDTDSWNQLGHIQFRLGNLDAALAAYEFIEKIAGTRNDNALRAASFGNFGEVARIRGNLDGAMDYYEKALDINKALGSQEGMAINYGNMGIVARIRGDLDAAMDYLGKALDINKALGRQEGMAINYGNMGNVAKTRGDVDAAMDYYGKALDIHKALGRKEGTAICYVNMGTVDQIRGDLDAAMDYYGKALGIDKALESKEGMAYDYGNMGIVAQIRGDLPLTRELWQKSVDLFTEVGAAPQIEQVQSWIDALEN